LVHSIVDPLGPVAGELLAAWELLPKRDSVPDRESFDPMAVVRILPVISLLQRVSDEEWHFRLCGTELERRWSRMLTGMNFSEILAPEVATIMHREFSEIVGRPCGSWSRRHLRLASGRVLTVETLRLPLRAKDGSVSLILSCSGELPGRDDRVPDQPRWIVSIEQQRFLDIGAGASGESILPGGM
jgi:hypothetical protein